MYVKVAVEVPKSMNHAQKDLLKKFMGEEEPKQYPRKREYEEAAQTVKTNK